MKRIALIVAGALLMGCSQDKSAPIAPADAAQQTPAQASPVVSTPVAPAVAPAAPVVAVPVPPAPAPAVAKPMPIFELTQDNKIYVFGSVQAMTDFSGGKVQPSVVEKPNFTPGGRTVVIEATDPAQADEILAGYNKLHPVAK